MSYNIIDVGMVKIIVNCFLPSSWFPILSGQVILTFWLLSNIIVEVKPLACTISVGRIVKSSPPPMDITTYYGEPCKLLMILVA